MEDQLHATIDTEMSSLVDGFDPAEAENLDSFAATVCLLATSPVELALLRDQAGRRSRDLPPMAPAAGWYDLPIPVHIDGDGGNWMAADSRI